MPSFEIFGSPGLLPVQCQSNWCADGSDKKDSKRDGAGDELYLLVTSYRVNTYYSNMHVKRMADFEERTVKAI